MVEGRSQNLRAGNNTLPVSAARAGILLTSLLTSVYTGWEGNKDSSVTRGPAR